MTALTSQEARIVAMAPPGWLDQPPPPGCTIGQCAVVKAAWGVCMCELVRRLQASRDKAGKGTS